ncbi:gliding motility-associated C-terminal domain-containing protein [Roseivirga sp.]|uniref:T9SS type B sorting domain-containing protein n=1 Tax=Roseivirga sp. TaxID=1964215 RepID=UPI003B8D3E3B
MTLKTSRSILVSIKLFLWSMCFMAYTSQAQTGTTEGREFYVGFMVNGAVDNPNKNTIIISSKIATQGRAEISGTSFSRPFTIGANSIHEIEIPEEFEPSGTHENEKISIRIRTNDPVSVFAFNQDQATSDGTMVLPVNSLGENYLINAYNNDFFLPGVTQNEIVLVATADSTIYEMLPSADILNTDGDVIHRRNVSFRDTLFLGDQVLYFANDNLSGTSVDVVNDDPDIFCKPIAVFSGHVNTLVDDCQSADHLYHQLYPTGDWGKSYAVVPFATRTGGDVVQILAAENNTSISTTNGSRVLDKGERWVFKTAVPTAIEANKRISVLHLSRGKECDAADRGNNLADPFMIVLSPSNQIIKDIVFYVASTDRTSKYFVNMVSETSNLQVSFEGVDISSQFSPIPGKPELSQATIETNKGSRSLKSTNGVVAHVYGFGESESFGYAVGGNLGEFEVLINDEQLGVVNESICEASLVSMKVTSDISILKETYTSFRWEISDGTILFGDDVTHEFAEPGEYVIDMIASKETSQCSNLIVRRTVNVIPDGIERILGPISICPSAQDIVFEADGILPGYTYEWFVNGGTIDGLRYGNQVVIDWNVDDNNPQVQVVARSPNGCLSDTVTYDILLNETLEPLAPFGPNQLCSDDVREVRYWTPQSTGSSYTWEAVGGAIVDGQGTNEVRVTWSSLGQHTLRFYETTTVNSQCDGVSQDLLVTVLQPISFTSIETSVSCFGESDGKTELSIDGGLAPYTVIWGHGASGTRLGNLSTGIYSFTITDALNCTLEESITITSPDLLQATINAIPAVCNGSSGKAIANVIGGTAPFRFNWSDGRSTTLNEIGDLPEGNYSVQVLDANDCETLVNFSIDEPSELVAIFEEKQACPGESDGMLSIAVSGGTAPYTFNWQIRPNNLQSSIDLLSAGTYEVTIVDANGCDLSVTADVTNIRPLVRFPTAFSPNNDMINDTFGAVFNCSIDFNMVVYNQWGTVIFSTNDINEQWDGTFEGKKVPSGTYSYAASYQAEFNGNPFSERVRGRISVIY